MWECPDFFPLGKKHVLLYSTAGKVIWESGELDPKELKFHSARRGFLDHGAYYAQKTQLDAHGNRILWGWIPEKRPDPELIAADWAGCMALPRVLTLSAEGELEMTFAPEVQSLRGKASPLSRQLRDGERRGSLPSVTLENVRAELTWKDSAPALAFLQEDIGSPQWSATLGLLDSGTAILNVNGFRIEIPSTANYLHDFHLFLDASVAELIVDRRHAITTRIYRKPYGPLHLKLGDRRIALTSLNVWPLQPISSDRLTT